MAPKLVVGIDLGTTHTVVAWAPVRADADPEIFQVPQRVSPTEVDGRSLLPSFLYAPLPGELAEAERDSGDWVIGEFARRRAREVPGRAVTSAKSWLSHSNVERTAPILPWATEADVPRLSPVDASALVLSQVRRAWDRAHPRDPLHQQLVILTVPASFDPVARELTVQAAQRAGLDVRLLEEPQAAFHDYLARAGVGQLAALVADGSSAEVLVCDVGGGTTDLTLISVARSTDGELVLERSAVGRHLLLGGDNVDLALAHVCEAKLVEPPARLPPEAFSELVLACHAAKERLLSSDAPDSVAISVARRGATLVGATLSTTLSREETERLVFDGFLPLVRRDEPPPRGRSALVAFGLPYESEPAITRHLAAFLTRHGQRPPAALLLNGGLFRAPRAAERLREAVATFWGVSPRLLPQPHPDLAVARGAVAYGLSLCGFGTRIGGGSAHGYYVAVEADGGAQLRGVCVVPRGSLEGERHAVGRSFALRVGEPVRFDLFASDVAAHAPGQVVDLEGEDFQRLPPVGARFEASDAAEELPVGLEGELTATGTVELACVELTRAKDRARRFRLTFDLRSRAAPAPPSTKPEGRASTSPGFDAAAEAIERIFGKGRKDVSPREVKDLLRELERLLGERRSWSTELNRALFDRLIVHATARRRSPDHERLFFLLAGFCLRPGFGHAKDPSRAGRLAPLIHQPPQFQDEVRSWQQYWICWRRVAAGLDAAAQTALRGWLDPFLAPAELKLKRPKKLRPQALDEMVETASWLERVPAEDRAELGSWLLERTWTDRDPRLWTAIGRIGARVPAYASAHHVVPVRSAERFIDHLLREKWDAVPTAARAAYQLARVTGDRTRDLPDRTRFEVADRLAAAGAPEEWVRGVREYVPFEAAERAELFGDDLPVGLRWMD